MARFGALVLLLSAGCSSRSTSDPLTVEVVAKQYAWTFRYPDGSAGPELKLPVGRPVRLLVSSQDVVHTLWIPELKVKVDAVPGRASTSTVLAAQRGAFTIACAEYCGPGHSTHTAKGVVE